MRCARSALVVAVIPLVALSPELRAEPLLNFGRVTVSPNFSGGTGPFDQFVQQVGVIDLSGSATGGFGSSGSGSTHVEYGLIRLQGEASVSLNTILTGYMRDRFTITAPGVPNGTPGTLVFAVTITGVLSATSGSSASSWTLQGDVGSGTFDLGRGGRVNSPDLGGASTGDPFGTYTSAVVPFVFGSQTTLDIELTVAAQASNSGNGSGAASIPVPVRMIWGGFSNVKANGSAVNNAVVTSDSGTDWSKPAAVCRADFDGDGFLTGDDFDQFVVWFELGDLAADFDGDGFVTGDDFDAFVTAFEIGC